MPYSKEGGASSNEACVASLLPGVPAHEGRLESVRSFALPTRRTQRSAAWPPGDRHGSASRTAGQVSSTRFDRLPRAARVRRPRACRPSSANTLG
jgi:hypothetical protein